MEEENKYVAQLREVFDSCDKTGAGRLDRDELAILCQKLQLEAQSKELIDELISQAQSDRVAFEDFKEGFVNALSSAVDTIGSSSGDEHDKEEVIPKYVKGDKKYGRRSRPDFPTDTEATDYSDTDFSFGSPTHWSRNQTPSRERLSSISSHESGKSTGSKKVHSDQEDNSKAETYEAEGQMNQSLANIENGLDPVSEEQHLRTVWKELGVGEQGYLTVGELSNVCEHIGMDDMTTDELQNLFDKLDVDQDGHVSFDEFLNGLFQHGGPNMPSTPIRPHSSVKKDKLRLAMSINLDDTRTQTPSIIAVSGAGIFTQLDPHNSGYAKSEDIVEMWEELNVRNGVDILQHLDVDANSKVNLLDLSYALEQEMMSVEEDNSVYQAAVVTCHQELKHLKSTMEHATSECSKVKTDLNDSNLRNVMLVKETDDRLVHAEKVHESKIRKLEKKYQEQIKGLQADIEEERDILTSQVSKQKTKLETSIEILKDDEFRLRDKVTYQQKEIDRLEKDLLDSSEKLVEFEKVNFRLQREVDSADNLRSKLAELESNRAIMNDEQHRFVQQKLEQLEADNKELLDKNDEFTMEVESLKQQISSNKRRRRDRRTSDLRVQRTGSTLSDYAKAMAKKTASSSDSDVDSVASPSRTRRKLPSKPKSELSSEEEAKQTAKGKQQYETTILELQTSLDTEYKERESKITEIKEKHSRELKQEEEKNEREREIMSERFERDKIHIEQQFADEKVKLTERLKEEFQEDLDIRTSAMKQTIERSKSELESSLTQDRKDYDHLLRQKTETELKMKLQKEELELEFERNKSKLREKHRDELQQQAEKHRLDIYDYENIFLKGEDALHGKLREDFFSLLEKHKEDTEQKVKEELLSQFEIEKADLCEAFAEERSEIEEEYRKQLDEIESHYQLDHDVMEQELADRIREDLEDEFMQQMERIQGAFQEERQQLEDRIDLLTNELDEREQLLNENDSNRESSRSKEVEYRRKLDELNRSNVNLKDENTKTERQCKNLKMELQDLSTEYNNNKQDLEMKDQELIRGKEQSEQELIRVKKQSEQELLRVKEQSKLQSQSAEDKIQSLVRINEESVIATKQHELQAANTSMDKAIINDLEMEKVKLTANVRNLESKIRSLQIESQDNSQIQAQIENHEYEKQQLEDQLEAATNRALEASTALSILESKHVRDLQSLKEHNIAEVTAQSIRSETLVYERKVKELEEALEVRSRETNKLIMDNQENHRKQINILHEEKDELKRKLHQTKDSLREQVENIKSQMEKNTKTGYLVKDLYIENAHLMKALAVTEERHKNANNTNTQLKDKCRALQKLLSKISRAALYS